MNYSKIVSILLILFTFLSPSYSYAQTEPAQPPAETTSSTVTIPGGIGSNSPIIVQSNTLCVRVGEPASEKPEICNLPPPNTNPLTSNSEGLAKILEWDEAIVAVLQTGVWGYYNRMMTNFSDGDYSTGTWAGTNEGNLYWCTYSIIDSYRLAGVPGLGKDKGHAAVVGMRSYWKSLEAQNYGYIYVDYEGNNQNLINVQPGYAMFMESVAGQHTGREHVNMVKEISIDANGNGYFVTNDSNSSSKSRKYTVAGWKILNTIYPVRGFGGI